MSEAKQIDRITEIIGKSFRTFGGSQPTNNNPIAVALKGKPYQFAACVDVGHVVEAVLNVSGHDALLEACEALISENEYARHTSLRDEPPRGSIWGEVRSRLDAARLKAERAIALATK